MALASIVFKIKEKDFLGEIYDMQDKESISKLMVQRLHNKVGRRIEYPSPAANTTVPYFDIDYFTINDMFLQPSVQAGGVDKLFTLLPPERRRKLSLADMSGQLHTIKEGSPSEDGDNDDVKVTRERLESPSIQKVQNEKIEQFEERKKESRKNSMECSHLQKSPMMAEKGNRDMLEDAMGSSGSSSRRGTLLNELSIVIGPKTAGQAKIILPRMLIRTSSSEKLGGEEAVQPRKLRNRSMIEPGALTQDPKLLLQTTPSPPVPKKQSIKPALNITTTTIGLLYRITSTLQKRDLMNNLEEFNQHITLLKSIYGLHGVQESALAIKNQCLSKLGHFFVLDQDVSDKLKADKGKKMDDLNHPDSLAMKKTATLSYFDGHSPEGSKLFPESNLVTIEMLSQLEKFIPRYICDSGWELLHSRIRDGSSYNRYSSLSRLLKTCGGKGEILIVIQDTQESIFGGYFSQSIVAKPDFFGTGESFLFRVEVISSYLE